MVHVWISLCVVAVAAAAEWLHARRCTRLGALAHEGAKARAWTRGAPVVRALAAGALAWGGLTLLTIDGVSGAERRERAKPTRHVLVCLDASPSMLLEDAGPTGRQRRGERAAELLESVFSRLDMEKTRISVIAFYTTAKPVVIDTDDMSVVTNILRDLPLVHAFKAGPTNMYSGVREAAKIAKDWAPGSALLVIVSDGDTVPSTLPPGMPASIGDVLVLGVGSPTRTTPIAGHASRQDSGSLRTLAAKLRGEYVDGNARHVPSATLDGLAMLSSAARGGGHRRTLALVATGFGAGALALMPLALAVAGRTSSAPLAYRRLGARDGEGAGERRAASAGRSVARTLVGGPIGRA